MKNDYIIRQKTIENLKTFAPEHYTELINQLILKQPAENVQEVRHGKWVLCYEDWRKQIAGDKCSVCGFEHYGTYIGDYHFCPNCGAKMDLGD